MSNVVALIPARSGSKGVPNKNIRDLGGHPLIEWSIRASLATPGINRVIVSTDSQDYADRVVAMGAEAPFLRPPEISNDRSTDYEFVVHALDWLKANAAEPEYVVHIRPTTPLRDPEVVEAAIMAFMVPGRATALRSVHEMSESAYKTFELAPEGQLKRLGAESTALDAANNARQSFPTTYIPNGYVDVLSTAFIRRTGLLHGDFVIPHVTPPVTEVDTQHDFMILEFELGLQPNLRQRLFPETK
jgi:CMP-N,N'-diacetyllegionaminic acid synthase